jgi:hypothetical protein
MLRRDTEKLSLVSAVFGRYFSKLRTVSLMDATRGLALQYEAAERRERQLMADTQASLQVMAHDGEGIIARIRAKEMETRTDDEKKILAIDVLLHPEVYANINTR